MENEFKLIGIKLDGKTTNKDSQSSKDCGGLWQKFKSDNIFDRIPEKLSDEIYAVYYGYDKDETAPFSYFIGCKVDKQTIATNRLHELMIPAQQYTKFTAKGAMTGCISDTWKDIWDSEIKRTFRFDFEVYDERSRDWSDAEVDIFISTTVQSDS